LINRAEIKASIRKIEEKYEGVRGVIFCDSSGLPIDSNMEIELSEEIAAHVTSLIGKGRKVVEALGEGNLKFIRLETSEGGKDKETMIALEENFIFIVLK
jgi:predicted regulator of Ras-like GTPase activity (Roadblock/LC7/MglB family)